MPEVALCDFLGASFLVFGPEVPALVYYSHLPVVILSLLIGVFVWKKGGGDLSSKLLLFISSIFATWVFLDSIFWASNRSDVILAVWSVILLIEPLVHAAGLYLLYSLIEKKDLPFALKSVIFLLFLPLIIFVPTNLGLQNFDVSVCLATEGPLALYYTYFVEIVLTLWLVSYSVAKFCKTQDPVGRQKIFLLAVGMTLFLFAFSWGNITGSFTEDWQLGQYGLFGMPIFMAFLAYSIVRFKLFNIKLIGANVLVTTLWILVGALIFIAQSQTTRIVVIITEVIAIPMGILLIRSVRREVKQRERIELLAKDLEQANEKLKSLDKQKTEFLSIASHQLRAPLTAIKGYSSMILENSFGEVSDKVRGAVDVIFQSSQKLVTVIEDFLNITRIELGKMKYEMGVVDLRQLVQTAEKELRHQIEQKGLTLKLDIPAGVEFKVTADAGKIAQVITNLIDNAGKYTKAGSVVVALSRPLGTGKVRLAVTDTGVGLSPGAHAKLFEKFIRADDAGKVNIIGTGLGLYVAKQIIDGHKGKIWAESPGPGKGSTFYVEL